MTTTPADIRLMVFDVDGVLTDGGITYHGDAAGGVTESKRFHTRDGLGLRAAMSVGVKVAVLTARSSRLVEQRMTELGVDALVQGCADKGVEIERLCDRLGVPRSATAYLGDDLVDLPAMARVGYPMAVADAAAELFEMAAYVTKQPGGHGAAREAVEHVLRAQGRWDAVVASYRGGA